MALRVLRWLLSALAVLAALCVLLVSGALWYGHTQDALERAVAQAVDRSGGRLQIEGASGSVLGPFAFARIAWKDGAAAIVAEGVRGEWSPLSLLARRLQVVELSVARLTVASTGQGQAGGLPESLALPVPLAIDRLTIAILELRSEGMVVDASGIELAYLGDEGGHHLRGLRVSSTIGVISGDAELGLQPPYAVAGKLSLARADQRRPIAASATLRGDLGRLMLEVQATVGSAKVSGAGTLRPSAPSWLQSLSLKGSAVDLAQFDAAWPRTDLAVAGSAATTDDGTIGGSFEIDNATAGALTDDLLPMERAEGAFRLEGKRIRLSDLRVALAGGGSASGSATVGAARTELDLALSAVNLRSIHRPLRSTRLAGTVRAQIAADSVTANALLRERDLSLSLDLVQRGKDIELRQFRAEARGGSLAGSGRVALTGSVPFAMNARAARLNPAAFGDFVPASIDAAIEATGALQPQWAADLRFKIDEHSRLHGVAFGGEGHLLASPGRVRDATVRLHVASNVLQAHGAFGQLGDHLDFALDGPRLKEIDPKLDGKISVAGSIAGSIAAPDVSFDLHGSALRAGDRYAAGSLTATGKVRVETEGEVRLAIEAKELVVPRLGLANASLRLTGTMAAHDLELRTSGPVIDASLKISGGWHDGFPGLWRGSLVAFEQHGDTPITLARPVAMELTRDSGQLSDATLEIGAGRLIVRHLRWAADGLDSKGEFTAIPAALLMKFAGVGENVRSTLLLGGDWSVVASPRLNGLLRVRRETGDLGSRYIAGLELGLTAVDIDVRLENDALTATLNATSAQFGSAGARLDVAPSAAPEIGSLDRDAPAKLAASFELASLRAVAVFTGTRAVIDGRLQAKIEGSGTLGALDVTGQLEGDDLRIDAPQYGIAIHGGSLRADLRNDELHVSELRLAAGDGQFTATGVLPLRADPSALSTVQWTAEKFTLLNRPDARLVLEGSGVLTWEARRIGLSGNLRAAEGHFEFAARDTTRLSDDVVIKGRTAPEDARDAVAKVPLRLDLDLDLGPKLTFIGHGVEARLAGRVKVTTAEDGALIARGKVSAINGTYLAFGQRLVVERGNIYFDGPIENPSLDFLALRRNLPVEVGITVTGTARAPRAQLTSNPPLPDGEKLSWLVLGHGLDSTSGRDNAALQSAAALLFQSTFATSGAGTFPRQAGLDDISIQGRAGGAEGQVLSFGKRLSEGLYVAFDQGLTIASNALRLEYSLTPSVMLRATAGTVSSFGIYYTHSFR
jgi:translocation and assembly module TamB